MDLLTIPLVFLALLFRTFWLEAFNMPSGSMIPTLLVGDYFFVSKFQYGYSRYSLPFGLPLFSGRLYPPFSHLPQRGDVAVFRLSKNPSTDYIKRIVGLPGDRIQMRDGELYINDQLVPRTLDPLCRDADAFPNVPPAAQLTYLESLPRGPDQKPLVHCIVKRGNDGPLDNTVVFAVPAGDYFAMGDNRDNSLDSRVLATFGYIPIENFVGRASFIYYSRDGGSTRFNRLLQAVH